MSEELAVEQADESVIVETLDQESSNDEALEPSEVEIVSTEQSDSPSQAKRDPSHYILERIARRDKRQENDRITALENQLRTATTLAAPATVELMPTLESCEHDEALYSQRMTEWSAQQISNAVSSQLEQQQHGHTLAARKQQESQSQTDYAQHAAKLNISNFNEMQDRAFDVLGDDFAQLILKSRPKEAPKLMYYFGVNPDKAAEYRDKYIADPGNTTWDLATLATSFKLERKTSTAANPETTVDASGLASSEGDFKKAHDAIYDKVDSDDLTPAQAINQVRELKRKAKAAGYDVTQLR